MKISILTLFPNMFSGPFDYSILKRAREKKFVTIEVRNLRDFGIGKHKVVDDRPYGGGLGMILRVDVLHKAIGNAKCSREGRSRLAKHVCKERTILLDPRGEQFTQKKAKELARFDHLILVCGHYEGVDERTREFVDEVISLGDFVVTGGEIPSMLLADAVTRLVKGVLKEGVTEEESFSQKTYLEHPQYTRPSTYKNLSVPKVLLSGNHHEIASWRRLMAGSKSQR